MTDKTEVKKKMTLGERIVLGGIAAVAVYYFNQPGTSTKTPPAPPTCATISVWQLNHVLDHGGLFGVEVLDIAGVTEAPAENDTAHLHCTFNLITNHGERRYSYRTMTVNGKEYVEMEPKWN